jgi:hypothetical protein
MTKKAFIDTNIFIYAFENEKTPKKKKALKLIKNENIHFITSRDGSRHPKIFLMILMKISRRK